MTRTARRASIALACALPFLPNLIACTETSEGTAGGGDRVNSTRYSLTAEPSGGGAGGAGGVGGEGPGTGNEAIRICTPDVVILDGLPECFVAEVSTEPLDCSAPGHEELRPAWEDAARERECAHRGLSASACAELSLCGIVKASGSAQVACRDGEGAPAGYCAVDERTDGCSVAEIDSLFVFGVSPEAEALHISCAIVGSE